MSIRTTTRTVTFRHPFFLDTVGRPLPAGAYEVITDEELIESLSFPAYRRIATMMLVPGQMSRSSVEMQTIDPGELTAALEHDNLTEQRAVRTIS